MALLPHRARPRPSPTEPGCSTAPQSPLTSTRACRRRCVRGPKGHPSSGCSCWASDFFSRASTSGRNREGEQNNPKHAEVSSGAGQPLPRRRRARGQGSALLGAGAHSPLWVKAGGGQGHLWCPARSVAPGRLFSCQQLPPPGLHPSAPPAGPPGPSAGSNASPGAGSARAGLSTAPGALPASPPSTTASSPGRITHCEAQEGTEWPRAGREWGERVGDGLTRQQVGSGVFTL